MTPLFGDVSEWHSTLCSSCVRACSLEGGGVVARGRVASDVTWMETHQHHGRGFSGIYAFCFTCIFIWMYMLCWSLCIHTLCIVSPREVVVFEVCWSDRDVITAQQTPPPTEQSPATLTDGLRRLGVALNDPNHRRISVALNKYFA